MCRVLKIHPSGYYAWLHKPLSDRVIDDLRLFSSIKEDATPSSAVLVQSSLNRPYFEAGKCHKNWRQSNKIKKRSLITQVTFSLTILMNAHIHEDKYLNIIHRK
jgi:putative transposase